EIVRRALKTCGPVTASELASRLMFSRNETERHLAGLESKGAIFRGHFTRADAEQWCERYNLERIHRLTLNRLRAEVEPCADHEYAAFRVKWQHVGGANFAVGSEGLAEVMEQLAGLSFTPE